MPLGIGVQERFRFQKLVPAVTLPVTLDGFPPLHDGHFWHRFNITTIMTAVVGLFLFLFFPKSLRLVLAIQIELGRHLQPMCPAAQCKLEILWLRSLSFIQQRQ